MGSAEKLAAADRPAPRGAHATSSTAPARDAQGHRGCTCRRAGGGHRLGSTERSRLAAPVSAYAARSLCAIGPCYRSPRPSLAESVVRMHAGSLSRARASPDVPLTPEYLAAAPAGHLLTQLGGALRTLPVGCGSAKLEPDVAIHSGRSRSIPGAAVVGWTRGLDSSRGLVPGRAHRRGARDRSRPGQGR
jgi:hypothetical protein